MWPKNIVFYIRDGNPLPEVIEEHLQARPFAAPGGLDWFSEGFIPPASHFDQSVPLFAGFRLISLRRDDKVLPAGVIRDELGKKLTHIEATELRKVGRKEKLALKEQITDDLLPRAFTRASRTTAWDNGQFLFVNAASHNKAENLISCLREAVPPFPCAMVRTKVAAHTLMTDWLAAGEASGDFVLDSDATLQDSSENGAKIKISRADLTAEEIRQHIATGKQATTLGLIWRERIRFVLTDTLQLKRIAFLDVLQEEASQAGDDAASLFDASFRIMSSELSELAGDLIAALGGLVEEQDKTMPPVAGDAKAKGGTE